MPYLLYCGGMKRTLSTEIAKNSDAVGQKVTVMGWVHSRRDHGGLIFIDLRDHTGLVQLTIKADYKDFELVEGLRDEYVIEATGTVTERDDELRNPNIATGDVEIVVDDLRILNTAEALPIQVNSEQKIGEDNRLKYRFLDLRRDKMQRMLQKRAEMYRRMREYMNSHDFTEVSTPVLANSSPEGARDFLVPSRVHSGNFYALPQAPQQFKQLLMVGGLPRYYQIAACFRDEDPRADRLYGEFYQLDLEMSFIEDSQAVRYEVEPLIIDLVKNFAGKQLMNDEVRVLTYQEAMDTYGTDKPDLRFGLELTNLTNELQSCGFGVFENAVKDGGVIKALVVDSKFSRSEIDTLTELAKNEGAGGLPYMTIHEDGGLESSITKFFSEESLQAVKTQLQPQPGATILFGADQREVVNKALGALRSYLGDKLELKDDNLIALAWVIDFPFYELDDSGKLDFGHNPFTMPKGGPDEFKKEDKLDIIADQFDMVMNGYEICSGGIRNHRPDIMHQAFATLGYDEEYVEREFGAMLNAFRFGAPPHGGCAFGIDRMFMELMGESNIREVVAFPKNGSGVDVMMNSPSAVTDSQLAELHVELAREES